MIEFTYYYIVLPSTFLLIKYKCAFVLHLHLMENDDELDNGVIT